MDSEHELTDQQCARCGRHVDDDAQVCTYCGAALPVTEKHQAAADTAGMSPDHHTPAPPSPLTTHDSYELTGASLPISPTYGAKHTELSPPPRPVYPETAAHPGIPVPSPRFDNAPFWPRVAASLIDGLILVLPLGVVIYATLIVLGLEIDPESDEFMSLVQLAQIPVLLVQLAYFTLMNGTYGATLGKMALGMRIVRADGTPISYGVALGRAIMQMLLQNCTCSLFYLSVAINAEHRGWHDQIAGTRVIFVR